MKILTGSTCMIDSFVRIWQGVLLAMTGNLPSSGIHRCFKLLTAILSQCCCCEALPIEMAENWPPFSEGLTMDFSHMANISVSYFAILRFATSHKSIKYINKAVNSTSVQRLHYHNGNLSDRGD